MTLLGAVLAGGQSRRFGSDKALAEVSGQTLMAHAVAMLSLQAHGVVSCGRDWPGLIRLDDRPTSDLGPLGGLNAALHAARDQGFDAVLSVSVDAYPIPADLADRLRGEGPRHLAQNYLLGLWPSSLAPALDAHLAAGHRSARSWITACGAVAVDDSDLTIHNINTAAALALLPMAGPRTAA